MLFPYDVLMNYLMTLSHQDFWNNRTMIYLYSTMRTVTEASTTIGKVHQDPGVSLWPYSSISDTVLLWSFFFKTSLLKKSTAPDSDARGNPGGKKKIRHLDSYSPNQLSVGLYYVCKAKSWSEKTTYYRVLNINTTLKYLCFVLWFLLLKQVIRRDQLQNHSTI